MALSKDLGKDIKMILYILVTAIIAIVGATLYKEDQPKRGTGLFFVILTLVSGLRGEMGTDHASYNRYFVHISTLDWEAVLNNGFTMERGYVILNKLISYISGSPVFYTFVIAVLTMGFTFLAYRNRSKMPWLSILLFFAVGEYFDSFNLTRQVLAVSMCFFATKYINEKKKDFFKYLFFVLLASTIHSTAAIIMIPAYFLLKLKFTKKSIFIYLGIGVGLYLLFPRLLSFFQRWFPRYDLEQYGEYVNNTTNIKSIIPILGMFVFALVCIFMLNVDYDLKKYENRVALNGMALLMILAPLGLQMSMAARLSLYFRPFAALLATNVVMGIKNSKNKVIIISAISFTALAFIVVAIGTSPYNPYYLYPTVAEWFR